MRRLSQLALSREEPLKVQAAALRVLAILGENELVRAAVGKPPIQGRGLRILSLGVLRRLACHAAALRCCRIMTRIPRSPIWCSSAQTVAV